ncbi:MAG: ribonuclease D [Pseudomonadota bacterium]|nr:ribonuclease D [Pseudomonadota bacterium]
MPEPIWIARRDELPAVGRRLEAHASIGIDTEFLRERTFFPKLCVLQLAAGGTIWCVDTLRSGSLEELVPALTAGRGRKVLHAARQDLEAFYLATQRVISPLFDTQIAAGCIGFKPQIGYAELVKTLLDVVVPKGQTRTDWSKRPLSAEQLAYAADDVRYLDDVADVLTARLRELRREHWAAEDCAALVSPALYEPDPARAWERLRGLDQLDPRARALAKALAVWREKLARERNLPRAWIIADAAIFQVAQTEPASRQALARLDAMPANFNDDFAESLLHALRQASAQPVEDVRAAQDERPTAEQKALAAQLAAIVDARARELEVSSELLAPRGELRSLAAGRRDVQSLQGWRRVEIGERLLAVLT